MSKSERKTLEDAILLALKMEEGAMNQGMKTASRKRFSRASRLNTPTITLTLGLVTSTNIR